MDKTVYGKVTFKSSGCEDDHSCLHKYSISESIEDGATLPLYYNLAPNEEFAYCRFGTDACLPINPSAHQKVIRILMSLKPGQGHFSDAPPRPPDNVAAIIDNSVTVDFSELSRKIALVQGD